MYQNRSSKEKDNDRDNESYSAVVLMLKMHPSPSISITSSVETVYMQKKISHCGVCLWYYHYLPLHAFSEDHLNACSVFTTLPHCLTLLNLYAYRPIGVDHDFIILRSLEAGGCSKACRRELVRLIVPYMEICS